VLRPREVTDDEVAFYRENGWAKLESLIPAELAQQMLESAQDLIRSDSEDMQERPPEELRLGGGKVVDRAEWRDYHYVARDDRLDPFHSYAMSKVMGRNAQRMMGREVGVRYYNDMIAAKMPAGHAASAPTAWHQDWPYTAFDRAGSLIFWVALADATPEMGTMRFLTGSHREGSLGRTLVGDNDAQTQYPEVFERCDLSPPQHLKPGDGTVHNGLVLHGAPQNQTDRTRFAYIVGYAPGDALYDGRFTTANENLEINKPFDHPHYPLVYP
jgi:hypothetical protein